MSVSSAMSRCVASGRSLSLTGQMGPSLPAHLCKALLDTFGQKSSAFIWRLLCAGSLAKKKAIINQELSLPWGSQKEDEHLKIVEEIFSGRSSHVKEGKWKQRGNMPNRNRKEICVLGLPFLCQDFCDAGLHPPTIL